MKAGMIKSEAILIADEFNEYLISVTYTRTKLIAFTLVDQRKYLTLFFS